MASYGPPLCVCGCYMTFSDVSPIYSCPRNCQSYRLRLELYWDTPKEVRDLPLEFIDAGPWLEQMESDIDRERLIDRVRD